MSKRTRTQSVLETIAEIVETYQLVHDRDATGVLAKASLAAVVAAIAQERKRVASSPRAPSEERQQELRKVESSS